MHAAVSLMHLMGVETRASCRCIRTASSWCSITQRISSPLTEHFVQCKSAQLHERFHKNIAQKLTGAENLLVYNTEDSRSQQDYIHYGCSIIGRVKRACRGSEIALCMSALHIKS